MIHYIKIIDLVSGTLIFTFLATTPKINQERFFSFFLILQQFAFKLNEKINLKYIYIVIEKVTLKKKKKISS